MQYNIQFYALDEENQNNGRLFPVSKDSQNGEHTVSNGMVMPVLPIRNMVLYPGVLLPIAVARPKSQKLVRTAYEDEKLIAVCCQKNQDVKDPAFSDLYMIGTAARVIRTFDMPDGGITIILEGIERIMLGEAESDNEFLKAKIMPLPEVLPDEEEKEFLATASSIHDLALQLVQRIEGLPGEAMMSLRSISNPAMLVNYICVNFNLTIEEKQSLLQQEKMSDRAFRLLEALTKIKQMQEIKHSIQQKAREDMNQQQREYFLHQQIEAIQQELGDTTQKEASDMRERAKNKHWSDSVKAVFEEELKRLERMSKHSPEYATQQNYLETLLDLPWNEYTADNLDINNAQRVLDKDHYGMEKVKERILEYLSVLKVKSTNAQSDNGVGNDKNDIKPLKSPIICLYGPPGVGKTSLGKSIADALGRKFARISLGGLHDEAEIRGHRRTYIGAMPGRIIENILKVKSSNPVFVLDEIDKLSADYHGDPTSALLEVLDPEQNSTFHDNFLDIDYDLSKVMFIATANTLSTIPRPLLDRMELIEMTGYLQEEKVEIALRHLLPKQLENHGLRKEQLKLSKPVLNFLIDHYTRESGVRNLDRELAALCRKIVKKIAVEEPYNQNLTKEDIVSLLGKERFCRDQYENNKYIGVVTGLAWTQVGGEILFIECSLSPSKGPSLTLTGNLGDVMKESAAIALGYIKAHAGELGIKQKNIETTAVHIHVPEGAIPKDGPSAGITMTTAIVSAFTKKKIKPRLAMTGEMTLRGKVLPVGGIKEKILAAKRAGINTIVLCKENEKDILDIPEKYLKGMTFKYVSDISEVFDFALM